MLQYYLVVDYKPLSLILPKVLKEKLLPGILYNEVHSGPKLMIMYI